jgi:hypothetical protein
MISCMRLSLGIALLLGMMIALAGCSPRAATTPTKPATNEEDGEEPPAEGFTRFAAPGHKYHADLRIDKEAKQATVQLLDNRGRKPVPTKAESLTLTIKEEKPLQISLKPQRRDDDPKDESSRFVGGHERLGQEVDADKLEISATIAGKRFEFAPEKD